MLPRMESRGPERALPNIVPQSLHDRGLAWCLSTFPMPTEFEFPITALNPYAQPLYNHQKSTIALPYCVPFAHFPLPCNDITLAGHVNTPSTQAGVRQHPALRHGQDGQTRKTYRSKKHHGAHPALPQGILSCVLAAGCTQMGASTPTEQRHEKPSPAAAAFRVQPTQ